MLKRNTLLALGTAELHVSAILPNHIRRLVRPNSQNLESQTVCSHRLSAVTDCLYSPLLRRGRGESPHRAEGAMVQADCVCVFVQWDCVPAEGAMVQANGVCVLVQSVCVPGR